MKLAKQHQVSLDPCLREWLICAIESQHSTSESHLDHAVVLIGGARDVERECALPERQGEAAPTSRFATGIVETQYTKMVTATNRIFFTEYVHTEI